MIYQCPKCGLSKSDSAMGSVLPQCMCHWQTQPPQRQWVDLSDDEIDSIDWKAVSSYARAIEAKLKEKNT